MVDNPSATYRGYRKQALYVLWRILTDAEREMRSYRPEGEEDLAVFDGAGRLLEAVQVKDYATPLALSHFKPQSRDGFFARMDRRQKDYPGCRHILASFGPLGAELDQAIIGITKDRDTVVAKLCKSNRELVKERASDLIGALQGNVTFLEEARLCTEVLDSLAGTIAGMHGESAVELLLYWVFDASEHRRTLTRVSLLLQLQHIGSYLAALRDHTTEWMESVRPLDARLLEEEEIAWWIKDYRYGVQARWEHILADADCPRMQRLTELHEKLSRYSVVVIRGASGQGKSSLALRYLRDYCADGLRFLVRFVEGRSHAYRVANVVRGHTRKLRLKAVVLLDLAPSDSGWIDLVRELTDADLKVIVTVREEDFRRVSTSTSDLHCAELALESVTRQEAEPIYQELITGDCGRTLDFEEAWARFANLKDGPLLEFTHLVSDGQTLSAKVHSQVDRLQREASLGACESGITPAHLQLLALAAIANAAECRVDLRGLCSAVGLDPLTRPLAVLEHEYLLRQQGTRDEVLILGIHALRSQAVESALLRDCPDAWGALAARCLPLIVEKDIERFLLCAFSRRPEQSAILEDALNTLALRTWTHAGGVGRALLWLGVSQYERENHEQISAAVAKHDGAWWFLCDAYIGFDSFERHLELRKTLNGICKTELPTFSLTAKDRVFMPFGKWAENAQPPPGPPITSDDWILASDLAYWIGNKRIAGVLGESLRNVLPEPLPDQISMADLSRFISGRYEFHDEAFFQWHDHNVILLTQRFILESNSLHLADKDDEVKVFFPVVIADAAAGGMQDSFDLNEQSMRRIRLLRDLFPHRKTFSSEGLGLEHLRDLFPYADTTKAIPVENLPSERAVQLNGVFLRLVSYRLQRATSWQFYADAIFKLRRATCDCFRGLHRAWGQFLTESVISQKSIQNMPGNEMGRVEDLSRLPMFPSCAVDEWGFISEDQDRSGSQVKSHGGLLGNLIRFKGWQKSLRDYECGVGQVERHILGTVLGLIAKKNFSLNEEDNPDPTRLLLVNLASAWEALPNMQSEFRRWFARFVRPENLDELDLHERSTFRHLWAVAFAVVHSPLEQISGGAATLEKSFEQRRISFLDQLNKELRAVMAEIGTVRIDVGPHLIDGKRCLVVICDHASPRSFGKATSEIVQAIWRASQFGGWRPQEWTPLLIEWPYIFVTHLIRGRAILPVGAHLSLSVLFSTASDFQVCSHHMIAMSVPDADFRALGLRMWENPLVMAALRLQGGLYAFAFTLPRFAAIAEVVLDYGLPKEAVEHSLTAFSREITTLLNLGIDEYKDLADLLHNFRDSSAAFSGLADGWLARWECICRALLLSIKPDADLILTLDGFVEWTTSAGAGMEQSNALLLEMVDFALSTEAKDENGNVV